MVKHRHSGEGALPCCAVGLFRLGFRELVDTPLNPLLHPHIFQGTTAPVASVVDRACGQDAVSTSPPPPPYPPPPPTPLSSLLFSCPWLRRFAPLPRRRAPMFCLFTSRPVRPDALGVSPPLFPPSPLLPRTLLHTHRTCGRREPGRCTDVRMFRVWACALRSPLPARARRDVIACLAHHRSESAPSVGTPPPSQLCDKHQSRAAACAESRGCCYYYEGLGGRRRTGGCGDGSAASVLSKWMRGIARWSKQRYSRRW